MEIVDFDFDENDSSSIETKKSFDTATTLQGYEKKRIKVLLVFACPVGSSSLRLQNEERAIRESLKSGKCKTNIEFEVLPACRVEDLSSHLLQRQNYYNLIHFSGHTDRINLLIRNILGKIALQHGQMDESSIKSSLILKTLEEKAESIVCEMEKLLSVESERSSKKSFNLDFDATLEPLEDSTFDILLEGHSVKLKSGESKEVNLCHSYSYQDLVNVGVGSLAFEGDGGRAAFIPPAAFANLISQQRSLHCVVLNACGSRIQGDLLQPVVPLTICFEGKVSDVESVCFSRGFYCALAEGYSYEKSFEEGKTRMELGGLMPGVPLRSRSRTASDGSANNSIVTLLVNEKLVTWNTSFINLHCRICRTNSDLIRSNQEEYGELKANNSVLSLENQKLKSMISYGLDLLQSKDNELNQTKSQLFKLMKRFNISPDTEYSDEFMYLKNRIQILSSGKSDSPIGKKTGLRTSVKAKNSSYVRRPTFSSTRNEYLGRLLRKKTAANQKPVVAFGSTVKSTDDSVSNVDDEQITLSSSNGVSRRKSVDDNINEANKKMTESISTTEVTLVRCDSGNLSPKQTRRNKSRPTSSSSMKSSSEKLHNSMMNQSSSSLINTSRRQGASAKSCSLGTDNFLVEEFENMNVMNMDIAAQSHLDTSISVKENVANCNDLKPTGRRVSLIGLFESIEYDNESRHTIKPTKSVGESTLKSRSGSKNQAAEYEVIPTDTGESPKMQRHSNPGKRRWSKSSRRNNGSNEAANVISGDGAVEADQSVLNLSDNTKDLNDSFGHRRRTMTNSGKDKAKLSNREERKSHPQLKKDPSHDDDLNIDEAEDSDRISSKGWRAFLRERRRESKNSTSGFGSSVPRFDGANPTQPRSVTPPVTIYHKSRQKQNNGVIQSEDVMVVKNKSGSSA